MAKSYNDMTGEWEGEDDYDISQDQLKNNIVLSDPNLTDAQKSGIIQNGFSPAVPGYTPGGPGEQGGVTGQKEQTQTGDPTFFAKQKPTDPFAPVNGFDTDKLSNNGGEPGKYTDAVRNFSQGLGSGVSIGRNNLQAMVDYAKANGFANARVVGDDKIDYGDGHGAIDVVMSNGQIWFNNNPQGGGAGAPAAGGIQNGGIRDPRMPVFGNNMQLSSFQQQNNGLGSEQATALYNLLMSRAKQGLNVDPNDPIIRGQADAYSANQMRHGRQYLKELAERGGPNSNIGAEGRMIAEKGAQASAGFEASLMQTELNAKRKEIQDALTGAAGLLTAEQQLSLQMQLKELDAALDQYKFDNSLGQRESEFARGLFQQESEFGRRLGQQALEFDATDRYRTNLG